MQPSRIRPRWARRGWPFFGLVASCFVLYWVLTYTFDSSRRDVESVRRQFHPAGRTVSSGHSPFALPASSRATPVDREIENLEPSHAGWDSEVMSAAIKKQLNHLRQELESDRRRTKSEFSEIAAERFEGVIVPRNAMRTVFDDGKCQAKRLPDDYSGFVRTNSLQEQVTSLLGTGEGASKLRCSFKVTHIQTQQQSATSRVLWQLVR